MKANSFGTSSRSSSMMPPPRVPLMTPSASPPVQYFRRSDAPSPSKKRRISETPSLVGSRSRSGTFSSTPSFLPSPPTSQVSEDPVVESASARRVLDIWSQLADKYARGIDEDDIVDIQTGKIIKDRGFLSSSNTEWKFGCFMNLSDDEDEEEGGTNRVAQGGDDALEGDDGPDELDAFINVGEESTSGDGPAVDEDDVDELQRSPGMLRVKRLKPMAEPNPEDAADLAEFLEEERRRKHVFGDLDGETTDDDGQWEAGAGIEGENDRDDDSFTSDHPEGDAITYDESVIDTDAESTSVSNRSTSPTFDSKKGDETDADESDQEALPVVVAEEPLEISDDDNSEDEFGNWTEDEGTFVYAVDELEDTAPTKPALDAKVDANSLKGSSKLKGNHHTGVFLAAKSTKVVQLQTPPRSTSSAPSEPRVASKKTPKLLDLSDDHSTRRFDVPSDDEPDTHIVAFDAAPHSPQVEDSNTKRRSSSSSSAPRLIPEVVIPIRNYSSLHPPRPRPTIVPSDTSEQDKFSEDSANTIGKRNKGKMPIREANEERVSSIRHRDGSSSSRLDNTELPADSSSGGLEESFEQEKVVLREAKKRRRTSSHNENVEQGSKVDNMEPYAHPRRRHRHASSSRQPMYDENSDDEGRADPSSPTVDRRRYASAQPRAMGYPPEHYWSPYPYAHPEYRFKSEHPDDAGHRGNLAPYPYPPPLHDPAAQYQLAHALQTISAIMGGGGPPFPSPIHNPHSSYPQWPPRTPSRHLSRSDVLETPQSLASDPPLSSPIPSEVSEFSSSPAKLDSTSRGRSKLRGHALTPPRPRSAIRGSNPQSKGPFKMSRRVSFSSPEAVEIDVEGTLPSPSDAEDDQLSDGDMDRHFQPSSRGQTPGPPPTRRVQKCDGERGNGEYSTPRMNEGKKLSSSRDPLHTSRSRKSGSK